MLAQRLLVLCGAIAELATAHSHLATTVFGGWPSSPVIAEEGLTINSVDFSTRAYWMRQANLALGHPCPFPAFGAVIVNHTDTTGLGTLVCTGANSNGNSTTNPNPILHGEIAAIINCSDVLTDPTGPYKLTATEAKEAFKSLSLYTNAESCPMCASAIRWAGLREYIYGTTIDTLIRKGWGQIRVSSLEIFKESADLPDASRLLGEILTNETDPYFLWQFDPSYPCPQGCARVSGSCEAE